MNDYRAQAIEWVNKNYPDLDDKAWSKMICDVEAELEALDAYPNATE